VNALISPKAQLWISWVLLIGSVLAWPATALTVFRDEPQGILGLSWFAIILGAYNTIVTTQVNKTQNEATP
jgi:hypothetical protein